MKAARHVTAGLGRPRDPELHQKLLAAALALVEERGHGGFTMEEVARRTGASKATVYRRWRTGGDLLLEALTHYGSQNLKATFTGRIHRDVKTYFLSVFSHLGGSLAPVLRSLMAQAQADAALRERFRDVFIAARRAPVRDLLIAAQKGGQLSSSADVDFLLDLIFGAMWYRLLIGHDRLDERFATSLGDLVKRYAV